MPRRIEKGKEPSILPTQLLPVSHQKRSGEKSGSASVLKPETQPSSSSREVTAPYRRDDLRSELSRQRNLQPDRLHRQLDDGHLLRARIRAQGLAIQANNELIRQLQQQLQEKTTSSIPSSNPSKKPRRRQEESKDIKEWLDKKIKLAIQRNLEEVGLNRGRPSACDDDGLDGSPLSREIRDSPLPKGFRVPRFILYDGISDPAAHVRHFTQRMSVWGSTGHIYCRLFSSSLGDLPLKWFCALPRRSITSWQQLQSSFMAKYEFFMLFPRSDAVIQERQPPSSSSES